MEYLIGENFVGNFNNQTEMNLSGEIPVVIIDSDSDKVLISKLYSRLVFLKKSYFTTKCRGTFVRKK